MKILASLAAIASAIVLTGSTASAGHDSPLYRAASAYREAVCDFEDHVFRMHYIDRYDKRLVDELEDATSHLRSAARHPDDLRRLRYRYRAVESLHFRVESTLFGPDCYRHNPVLARCWERVTYAYADLAEEIRCVCGHRGRPGFGHGHIGHGHRDFDDHRWPIDRDRRGGRDIIKRGPTLGQPHRELERSFEAARRQLSAPPVRQFDPTRFRPTSSRRDAAAAILGSILGRALD